MLQVVERGLLHRLLPFVLAGPALALAYAPQPDNSAQARSPHIIWSAAGSPAADTLHQWSALLAPPVFGPNNRANQDATTNGQHEPGLAVSRVHTNTVVVA